jgi:hypothetical protein
MDQVINYNITRVESFTVIGASHIGTEFLDLKKHCDWEETDLILKESSRQQIKLNDEALNTHYNLLSTGKYKSLPSYTITMEEFDNQYALIKAERERLYPTERKCEYIVINGDTRQTCKKQVCLQSKTGKYCLGHYKRTEKKERKADAVKKVCEQQMNKPNILLSAS